jgi:hypothetical protein
MPARNNPASELAEKMIRVLEAQRRLGAEAYPLTLRRLAELGDPAASAELVLKAAAKRKPFSERVLVVNKKDLDSPTALLEDAGLLADSSLLLNFILEQVCSTHRPTCDAARLKRKVPAALKELFDASGRRRIEQNALPEGVAIVQVRNKPHLHLIRYPFPVPPEAALAENLVRVLKSRQALSGDSYPLPLDQLVDLTQTPVAASLLKKAMKRPAFETEILVAIKRRPDSPVALATDRDRLADSPLLLETMIRAHRKEGVTHVMAMTATAAKKLALELRQPWTDAVHRRISTGTLPPTIGCVLERRKALLFMLADATSARLPPPGSPQPSRESAPLRDFAAAFDAAFRELDAQRRCANFVSLVDLRRALAAFDRISFDAGLQRLRQTGQYGLSAAEGRHGISAQEQAAGIPEDGALLLFVSRKLR